MNKLRYYFENAGLSFKKGTAIILCLTLLIPMLAACQNNGGKNPSAANDLPTVRDDETDTSVPHDLKFEGEKFTVLCREDNAFGEFLHEIEADENETDIVNQAIYERNLRIEERFGVDYIAHAIPGQWDVKDDFLNTMRNSILSGSQAFDLIMAYQGYITDLGVADLHMNLYDVPYLNKDLSNVYFFQDNVKELTVNDTLFFLIGDYSLTYWEYLYVMYFNKQIAENENLEDIYQLVRDGKWTIDKCIEMTKGVYRDLDGNGWPGAEDQFGYITDIPNTTDAFFSHFDVHSTGHDEDGNVIMNIDQGKMVSILEKIIAFYQTDDVFTFYSTSDMMRDQIPLDSLFTENRALFYPERLDRAQDYRSMETDFGIVPYPKWNEEQENYYTQSQGGYSVAVIPIDVKNPEMSGAVLDVISALSYDYVTPAYYDMALKNKFARDNESGEMLDLIREGVRINLGYYYYAELGTGGIFRILIDQESSNFVSYYAANHKGYERNLKKILATYISDDN